MSLLTRYVLSDLLKVFGVTLAVMTALMILMGVAREALQQGLGPLAVVQLLPFILPDALRFSVPATILFATCSVYGRMAAHNEVLAIKSMGVSPFVVIRPVLVLAFALSLVTVWLNDVAVSWGRKGVQRVVLHSVERIVYSVLQTQGSYSTNRFSISVESVQGRKLIQLNLVVHGSGNGRVTLTAKEAELTGDPEEGMLLFKLFDGVIISDDGAVLEFSDTITHRIPLSEATRKGDLSNGPSQYPLNAITDQVKRQVTQIEALEQTMAVEAAFQMLGGDFDDLTNPKWNARHQELRTANERLHRLHTEPLRRWANGFSCFFFVFLGAPLAMRMRNADLWTSFGICFMPILLVYYPLLAFGVDRAKIGALPPYTVWLGNVILALAGLWMIQKARRY
ncbi:MAG: LptF/LptG family permease [Planctomycetes bacterium]|nr:LptF/LptG family permease [Planctomycetota bacterium]